MNRLLSWTIVAALGLMVAGCGGSGNNPPTAPDPTVQFFNGSCDTTSLEFVVNHEVQQTGIAYAAASAGFEDLEPSLKDVGVREVGTTEELWAESFDFVRDRDYFLCSLGLKTFGTEFEKRLRLLRFEIDRRAPNANKSRIYVIHGLNRGVGNQTTGIDFQNPGNNPQYKLNNVGYLNEQHIDIDSTTHTFEARRFGTESVYVTRTFTFVSGKIYAVVLAGVEGETGTLIPAMHIIELTTE